MTERHVIPAPAGELPGEFERAREEVPAPAILIAEPMNPSNVNRKLLEEIEPRRYQTNVSLTQPPTTVAHRPVREYVTNVNRRTNEAAQQRARRYWPRRYSFLENARTAREMDRL